MPLITCYVKLNFHFSDLRSLLPRRDTYINSYNNLKNPFQIAHLYICCIHGPHVAIKLNKCTDKPCFFLIRVLLKWASQHPSLLSFYNNPSFKSNCNDPATVFSLKCIHCCPTISSFGRVTIVVQFT